MKKKTLFEKAILSLVISLSLLVLSGSASGEVVPSRKAPALSLFKRTAMKSPGEQLEYSNALLLRGKEGKAERHYRALVWRWPNSDEAAVAQYQYAKLRDQAGKTQEAFEEYRYLSVRYANQYPLEEVLQAQLRLARSIQQKKHHRWLFGGWRKPEQAIPYLREILRHSPEWDGGAEIYYLIGTIYEQRNVYEKASQTYDLISERYPDSPFCEQAAFASCRCRFLASRDTPENSRASDRAWEALQSFLAAYPEGARAQDATRYIETLSGHRAKELHGNHLSDYEAAHGSRVSLFFRKPAKATAKAQWHCAEALQTRGHKSKARRYFRALVLRWPDAPEAPAAQYAYARIIEADNNLPEAFDEYIYLLERYRSGYSREEVLNRSFKIAQHIGESRTFSWFMGGIGSPKRALPYLETLLSQDKNWEHADQIQYDIGKIYEEDKQYTLAAKAYENLLDQYQESPLMEGAAFSRSWVLFLLARQSPDDDLAADHSTEALTFFETHFPDSTYIKRSREFEKTLNSAKEDRAAEKDEHAYQEEPRTSKFRLWGRPKRKQADEQLEYANRLRNQGRDGRARRQYKALVAKWPASAQAPAAQYEYGKLLEKKNKVLKAFEEYSYLMERYAGQFPHTEVLSRQFRIAKYMMDRRKGDLLFFPGFSAPERAIPLFEQIISNGPNGEQAAEARYLIGRAYDLTRQYESAIAAYTDVLYKHPNSPFAEKAAFSKAYDLYQLAQESPYDEQLTEATWASLVMFLNTYPKSDNATEALEYKKALYRRRAKEAYDKAVYYDRLEKNPKAARLTYRRFIEQFPNSGWTTLAEIRIQELNQTWEQSK